MKLKKKKMKNNFTVQGEIFVKTNKHKITEYKAKHYEKPCITTVDGT